ncbi:MAG TPA: glutamine synthetase, partial [Planctomycetota bacterium]|nr:glutamine synthetase [Planctomycetota bacterium]
NRSDLVRVPVVRQSREAGTRVEYRAPDPACNPYLAFACMLRAGLAGIRGKYELPQPVERNVYAMSAEERRSLGVAELPEDLYEAIKVAEGSAFLRETLGAHVFEKLLENKRLEWDEYRTRVTRWELDQYLGRL